MKTDEKKEELKVKIGILIDEIKKQEGVSKEFTKGAVQMVQILVVGLMFTDLTDIKQSIDRALAKETKDDTEEELDYNNGQRYVLDVVKLILEDE